MVKVVNFILCIFHHTKQKPIQKTIWFWSLRRDRGKYWLLNGEKKFYLKGKKKDHKWRRGNYGRRCSRTAGPSEQPCLWAALEALATRVWGVLGTQVWTEGWQGLCLELSLGQSGNSTVYWATVEMHAIFLVVGLRGKLYMFFVD